MSGERVASDAPPASHDENDEHQFAIIRILRSPPDKEPIWLVYFLIGRFTDAEFQKYFRKKLRKKRATINAQFLLFRFVGDVQSRLAMGLPLGIVTERQFYEALAVPMTNEIQEVNSYIRTCGFIHERVR